MKTKKSSRSTKSRSSQVKAHEQASGWKFMTNHSHVLMCLNRDPETRLRDVALEVGITERAVQKIVSDLEDVGTITRKRQGRRNSYTIHPNANLNHPLEKHVKVTDLIKILDK